MAPPMGWRLHRKGRWRAWLGKRLGGDAELGDRAWRRILHVAGAVSLLYLVLPQNFFVVLTTEEVLLIVLVAVLALDALRLAGQIEFPSMRPFEEGRPASFSYFAIALVASLLLFPEVIATAVILVCAVVDPLLGEFRASPRWAAYGPAAGVSVGFLLVVGVLALGTSLALPELLALAALAALVAVAVERPKLPWVDDDLVMTLAPGVVLWGAAWLAPALFGPVARPFT
ncbi:MAG: hypothetical protein L3K03_04855 [Thermoplasmata archaeon]|nr:hypothetical protein [Thermoplasmata archaeon]